MDRVERIRAAEASLDSAREGVDSFADALEKFAGMQADIAVVNAYLGSEEWFGDRDDSTSLPADLKAGILSEDLGYNLIVDNRDIAIRMLEVATTILRDY